MDELISPKTNNMPWTNFHSHTHYCDGKGLAKDYIKEAIAAGMPAYGVSSHAPINFKTDWCIPDEKFEDYLIEVEQARHEHENEIEVYLGLEIDYIPGLAGRDKHILNGSKLDYYIGSIHFVDTYDDGTPWNIDHKKELFLDGVSKIFKGNFIKASERFYEISCQMLREDNPDIIGHLDKIKMYNNNNELFDETDIRYRNQVEQLLNQVKESGTIVEVNTRGYYRYGQESMYPSRWILEKIVDMDIPVMLNSDSHEPKEICSGFEEAARKLKEIGVPKLWSLSNGIWKGYDYDESGLML